MEQLAWLEVMPGMSSVGARVHLLLVGCCREVATRAVLSPGCSAVPWLCPILPSCVGWPRSACCWDTKGIEFGSFSGQVCSMTALLVAGETCPARLRLQDP